MTVRSGLVDTSVVVDWHHPAVLAAIPDQLAISAITAAELAGGPHLLTTRAEAAKRQLRLQEVEATLEPIGFDSAAVRSYRLVVAAVVREGRKPRTRFGPNLVARRSTSMLDVARFSAPHALTMQLERRSRRRPTAWRAGVPR
jgi:predicted nucleic acid-binding protein